MIEIRWHGRGGQGAVTAAKLLAASALREGKNFQAFPEYGPERRGAPVRAFTRISDEPIRTYASVANPDIVVILDPGLIDQVPVTEGLKEDGIVVANYPGSPEELRERLGLGASKVKVYVIDAIEIAGRHLGRGVANTPMLGAVVRASGVVDLEEVLEEVRHYFGEKFSAKMAENNARAVMAAYDEAREA